MDSTLFFSLGCATALYKSSYYNNNYYTHALANMQRKQQSGNWINLLTRRLSQHCHKYNLKTVI